MIELGELVYFKDEQTSGIGIVKGIGIDHYFVTDPLEMNEKKPFHPNRRLWRSFGLADVCPL